MERKNNFQGEYENESVKQSITNIEFAYIKCREGEKNRMEELASNKSERPWYRCKKDIIVVSATILLYVIFMNVVSKSQIRGATKYIDYFLNVVLPPMLILLAGILTYIIIRSIIRLGFRVKKSENNQTADSADRRMGYGSFFLLVLLLHRITLAMEAYVTGWLKTIIHAIGIVPDFSMFIRIPFLIVKGYDLWPPVFFVIFIAIVVCRNHFWQWIVVAVIILSVLESYYYILDIWQAPFIKDFANAILFFVPVNLMAFPSIAGLVYLVRRMRKG